jgi:hypothetical protein
MQKRAVGGEAMVYVLVVVVLGAIAVVGWKMVSGTSSRFCNTELADFQLVLGEQAKGLRNGEVMEKRMDVPCGASNVYLFDGDNKPAPELFENPLLRDAVASSAAKNVYIVKGNNIVSSFEVPFLEIPYPYFTCMIPSSGKISFLLEGLGRGIGVEPSCEQKNCVMVPQDDATGTLEMQREYLQCGGKNLHMFIHLRPITPNVPFTYTETMASCVDDPQSQYSSVQGFKPIVAGERTLRYASAGISGPVLLSYEITIPLSDRCIGEISGEVTE